MNAVIKSIPNYIFDENRNLPFFVAIKESETEYRYMDAFPNKASMTRRLNRNRKMWNLPDDYYIVLDTYKVNMNNFMLKCTYLPGGPYGYGNLTLNIA